jgi:DNA-binding GntR family transcriptional regulator
MAATKRTGVEADGRLARSGTRYADVVKELIADIAAGRYEVGGKLPTEAHLCLRFGVSRATVRQALAEIERAGLVERRQGSGTTLVACQPPLHYALSGTSENDILRYAAETSLEITGGGTAVDLSDCRRFHLGDPTKWQRWEGIRRESTSGLPIGLTSLYLLSTYAKVMKRLRGPQHRAIFEMVATEFDLVLVQIDQAITATVLDASEAARLDAAPDTPALVITRRYSTAAGVFEVTENIHPSDRFSYELSLERDASHRSLWP